MRAIEWLLIAAVSLGFGFAISEPDKPQVRTVKTLEIKP